MLDFFEQQARAKRRTSWLVAWYVVGVAVFVAVVAPVIMAFAVIVAGGAMEDASERRGHGRSHIAEQLFSSPLETFGSREGQILWAISGGGTLLLVLGATAYKTSVLRAGGGRIVAESLGGRRVVRGPGPFHEQRLLNVVEEMAIASGVPVPPVYILDRETGINAFAAGYTASDAVVAVTRGAAESLTREQLQGVIGHEFSHILNGDMRLNIRLIGLLYGIISVQLLGRVFIDIGARTGRGGGKDSGRAAVLFLLFGVILLLLGLAGAIMAKIVKAMIGRQREYLADAASAQFTRNPEGLAQALRVVGGASDRGVIRAPQGEECSHLYFVEGVSGWLARLTDSHPPLASRIRRLDPGWDGTWLQPADPVAQEPSSSSTVGVREDLVANLASFGMASASPRVDRPTYSLAEAATPLGCLTAEEVFRRVATARELLRSIAPGILAAARDPHDARALVLAMLLDGRGGARQEQLAVIAQNLGAPVAETAARLDDTTRGLGPGVRLPLLEVALASMASLSQDQYRRFRSTVDAEIDADHRRTLFQTCIRRMLIAHLDRRFDLAKPPPVQYYSLARLGEELSALLSAVTMSAGLDGPDAERAIASRAEVLGAQSTRLVPPRELTSARLNGAFAVLATAATRLRVQIVRACAEIVGQDGRVNPAEAELLRAIADGLDVPLALPQAS